MASISYSHELWQKILAELDRLSLDSDDTGLGQLQNDLNDMYPERSLVPPAAGTLGSLRKKRSSARLTESSSLAKVPRISGQTARSDSRKRGKQIATQKELESDPGKFCASFCKMRSTTSIV